MCKSDTVSVSRRDRTVDSKLGDLIPQGGGRETNGFDRRVALKAAAGFGASAAAGGLAGAASSSVAFAQENGGTRAGRFTPAMSIDAKAGENGTAGSSFRVFQTDYPFYALGASWGHDVGTWPVIEVETSVDGETWSDPVRMTADSEDGGQPTRENRLYTPLAFTDGTSWVRFRTLDADSNDGSVWDLSFTYIDASDGPWEHDVSGVGTAPEMSDADTVVPPQLLTREQWGADDSYRLDESGVVIWPPVYELVHHVIVHHTDTPTFQDPLVAIRSIYYYHAVDQGWGDIGYNYLVDRNGRVYEGRYGGQDVVGGHSYQYAYGSSGICIIGDYENQVESDAARAGLIEIVAWVARDLDPFGVRDFLDVPNLPVVCAHRDVNSTACPGDMLYYDLPNIRSLVAETISAGTLLTSNPGGLAVRDRVIVQTDDGSDLNIRQTGSLSADIVAHLGNGSSATVIDGPIVSDTDNWYEIEWGSGTGWTVARYLVASPPAPVEGATPFAPGTNVMIRSSANMRADASIGSGILAEVPKGEFAVVLDGPISEGQYAWYQLRTQKSGSGWVARTFLITAPMDTNSGGLFDVGDTVVTTDSVSARVYAGLAQAEVANIVKGTVLTVTASTVWVTDHFWVPVDGDFGTGWVVQDFLAM